MKNILFTCYLFVISSSLFAGTGAERGYGDWPKDNPGHPSMRERRVIVLTNACRIAPTEYRDIYLVPNNSQASNILLPQNYPATYALYWQIDLNRVAKVHAIDMANNHGLSHSSSDGTSAEDRIKSYYTKSGWWGENIATGGEEVFFSMQQWLLDITPSGNVAADNSGDDGHRSNIMDSNYKEFGTGYAYGPIRWYHFWVQDFARGTPEFDNPITGAAHFVMDNNYTMFMANYSDPKGNKPTKCELVIDQDNFDLSVLLGNEEEGTYSIDLASADDCRYYYFSFTDSEGKTWRHPEGGKLITLGEGACDEEYEPPDTNQIIYEHVFKDQSNKLFVKYIGNDVLVIEITDNSFIPKSTLLVNCKGQVIQKQIWQAGHYIVQGERRVMRFNLDSQVSAGTYFLVNRFGNGVSIATKIFISGV